jgi:PIN domain nuclease of toxin-antitoxin system
VLLWWWFDPARLSAAVHGLLVDPTSEIWVSALGGWRRP